jgi:hypothetical protein
MTQCSVSSLAAEIRALAEQIVVGGEEDRNAAVGNAAGALMDRRGWAAKASTLKTYARGSTEA